MRIEAAAGPLLGRAPVVALPIAPRPDGPAQVLGDPEALDRLGLDAAGVLAARDASGKPGEVVAVPIGRDGVDTLLFVGVGDGGTGELRVAAAALARATPPATALATSLASGRSAADAGAIAEALGLAAYRFSVGSGEPAPRLERAVLVVDRPAEIEPVLGEAAAVAQAVCVARDLVNMPSLEKSPDWLAQRARELTEPAGVSVRIRDERELSAEGFGGILAVGSGSSRPPRLVEMTWAPGGSAPSRHVVLVGKGITFDSGGLSLKPRDAMASMKTDMAGGAAVIAAMSALAALGVPMRVTGLVPMAENLPGAAALRPGDVVRHYGGRTDEILNTDAEGRIVLADTLAYAVDRLAPDVIVDLATLTGAASLGLGKRHAALYATSDKLRDALVRAGEAAGERLWPMPLVADYRDALDSPVADLRNIGRPELHYSGGSIVAALFLREFVAGVPWAHLDIAGPARADADEAEVTRGATGFGVRTLLRWLTQSG